MDINIDKLMGSLEEMGMIVERNGNKINLITYSWRAFLISGGAILLFKNITILCEKDMIILKEMFNRIILLVVFIFSTIFYFPLLGLYDTALVRVELQPVILISIISVMLLFYIFLLRNRLLRKIHAL